LDAALALFVEGGGGAVRMAAVASALGAPSGSIYHRFAGRGALVGALWNRTTERFVDAMRPALADLQAVEAARACLAWCEAHPGAAQLLSAGPRFADVEWPAPEIARRRTHHREVGELLHNVAGALQAPIEDVRFALVELPMATVRRGAGGGAVLRAIAAVLPAPVALEWLESGSEQRLRRLRLRALLEDPAAFGSGFDETAARPPASWTEQLANLPTVVAVLEGRDVGMVRGVPGSPWELISLWVAPEVRGRGVGERLVHALVERVGPLELSVRLDNAAAQRLYARLGFETVVVEGEEIRLRGFS
jgi:ribosomal protein S18 acetylase RimI-like enzyme